MVSSRILSLLVCYSSDWEGGVLKRTYACGESITQYYNVLLHYYKVITIPVLLFTTTYYSSTTSVLQSTTPVLLCPTK